MTGRPEDYIYFSGEGTTPSGDSFTTLTNTLREIAYLSYYTRTVANKCSLGASGDDGTIKAGSVIHKI